MGDVPNHWRISDGTVRITLFRVLPGHELWVGRTIEALQQRNQHSFRVFRLFGSYDLVFISDGSSLFKDEFAHMGTIPYIMGADEYVGYKWKPEENAKPSFSIDCLNDPLLALCFLKINPRIVNHSGLDAELDIAGMLRKECPEVQMVGTFGWFETILLLSDSSLGRLLERVGNKIPDSIYHRKLTGGTEPLFLVEKSFTLLGHHLDVSDPACANRMMIPLDIDGDGHTDLAVNLSISCKPSALRHLTEDAAAHFGLPETEPKKWSGLDFLFGPRDVNIKVPVDNLESLNQLLHLLDTFRAAHTGQILKTYTDIYYQRTLKDQTSESAPTTRHPIINLTEAGAELLVGIGSEGGAIASALYGYNNLLQNSMGSDAFLDLLEFVRTLRDLPARIRQVRKNLLTADLQGLVQRLNLLEEAIDQRSQGVYTGFDETPFTPGFTGTAMVRIYKALEAYVGLLLKRFRTAEHKPLRWAGFVMFGSSSRFEQKHEVVIIPQNSGLRAINHWCLTHESMHILQYRLPDLLDVTNMIPESDDPAIEKFRVIEREYGFLMLEMTADVLDYAFFCPGHIEFDDYVRILWKFLSRVVIDQDSQITNYLFRSFAVLVYVEKQAHPELDPSCFMIQDTRALIQKKHALYKEIDWVRPYFQPINESGVTPFELKVDEFHKLIRPSLSFLFSTVEKVRARYDPPPAERTSVEALIDRLNDGYILDPEDMLSPELLTWSIAKRIVREGKEISEKGDVALLLSLWNAYHKGKLGIDLSKLTG